MDPTANIKDQHSIATNILQLLDSKTYQVGQLEEIISLAENLAELSLALIEWRKKGGFDPNWGEA